MKFVLPISLVLSQIVFSAAQSVRGCASGQIGVGVDSTVDFIFSEIFSVTCNPINVIDSSGSANPCTSGFGNGSTVTCNSNMVTGVTTPDGIAWACSPIPNILDGMCGDIFFGIHVQYCCSRI